MRIKRMGVMNITPNSFSDGGELSVSNFLTRLDSLGPLDALDIGAESTAPMNEPLTHEEEWERLIPILPFLRKLNCPLSVDTYHPETIFRMAHEYQGTLIWNDVSGKFDQAVSDFLKLNENFLYVFCHNLAPSRELTIRHMSYLSSHEGDAFLNELVEYFGPKQHPRVIFDPCFGFSKTYAQNWYLLEHFPELQKRVFHSRWLLGLSRKSFIRKRYDLTLDSREELDRVHSEEVNKLIPSLTGEVWIRTHRPEMLKG